MPPNYRVYVITPPVALMHPPAMTIAEWLSENTDVAMNQIMTMTIKLTPFDPPALLMEIEFMYMDRPPVIEDGGLKCYIGSIIVPVEQLRQFETHLKEVPFQLKEEL